MNVEKVALFGLGKLGLPLSLVLAQEMKVVGIDTDIEKIKKLCVKTSPFYEPHIDEYLNSAFSNISFKTTNEYSIDEFDVAIILVNTPSDSEGKFSNKYIYDVIEDLSIKLRESNKKDFLFILSSTVMPNSHKLIIDKIQDISGKKLNEDFGFVYVPDLVALGSVIKDFENPDLLIMGESHIKYGNVAEKIYKKIIKNNSPIKRMSLIEGEITKVSLNAYITTKISFANFIGNVSEKFNCNPNNITSALGFDRRISPHFIKSGLAFGGTCFPRDTWAFIKMADDLGLDAKHIKATQEINDFQNENLLQKLLLHKNKKIGVLGLSFKPNTTVDEKSPGLYLSENLKKMGVDVITYDKLIGTEYFGNFEKFVNDSDVIVITHNDSDFEKLKNFNITNKVIINPWNLNLQ
jgi:UDPglucose 6-dehydrogenase